MVTKYYDTNNGVIVRDYRHASSVFLSNKEALTPRLKFQFHVYFQINDQAYSIPWSKQPNYGLSLAVKTVKLPQFTIQTHDMNQYNRKRIVQTRIKYENTEFTFHDDVGNSVRNMWYNYYSYYYDDPNNSDQPPGQTSADSKAPINYNFNERTQYQKFNPQQRQSWGYVAEGGTNGIKVPFFRNIIIYGLDRFHNFVAYTLINPMITSFRHDTYNYNEGGGIMENSMSIAYEFVKYDEGVYDGSEPSKIIQEFAKYAYYDTLKSPRIQGGLNAPSSRSFSFNSDNVMNNNREFIEGSGDRGNNQNRRIPNNPYSATPAPTDPNVDYGAYNNVNAPSGDPLNPPDSLFRNDNTSIRNQPFYIPVADQTPLILETPLEIPPIVLPPVPPVDIEFPPGI